ncbi:MAG: hypothetical protein GF309_16225 [Candidatus Lokiarchaeota archaeon]|nr:hypothetical protein [Candidatus Lokiarchaeota archaeon]
MNRRNKAILLALSILIILSSSTLVDATKYYTMDDGHHGGTYGSSTSHSVQQEEARVYADAPFGPVEGWAWLAVEVTLSSSERVDMDAEAYLTAYLNTWGSGSAEIHVYFRCIDPDDFSIEWGSEVWDHDEASGGDEPWDDEKISDDFTDGDFPMSTPSGTWLFVVHFEFDGSWGARLQRSSSDTGKAILEVDTITVSY